MMRYYLHINPETLNDYQWSETYAQLADIREKERRSNS
jgi:hypothetical protein